MRGRPLDRCRHRGRRPAVVLAPAVAGTVLAGLVGACGVEIDHEVRPIPATGGAAVPAPAVAPSPRLVDVPDAGYPASPALTTTPGPTATPPVTGTPRTATSPRTPGPATDRRESPQSGQAQG